MLILVAADPEPPCCFPSGVQAQCHSGSLCITSSIQGVCQTHATICECTSGLQGQCGGYHCTNIGVCTALCSVSAPCDSFYSCVSSVCVAVSSSSAPFSSSSAPKSSSSQGSSSSRPSSSSFPFSSSSVASSSSSFGPTPTIQVVDYDDQTFVPLGANATITSIVGGFVSGLTLQVFNGVTCTTVITAIPAAAPNGGFCFTYAGATAASGQYVFTFDFVYTLALGDPFYQILVNNFVTADDTVLGPVFPDTVPSVIFNGANSNDSLASLYVVLSELPINGFFQTDSGHVLNSSDIGTQFLLTDNTAPFTFTPVNPATTVNNTVTFNIVSQNVESTAAVLTIIVHAAQGMGTITIPAFTCQNLTNTLCLTDGSSTPISVELNYTDAPYWPVSRLIFLQVEVDNPLGATFTLNPSIVVLLEAHIDLNGDFNSDIGITGSGFGSNNAVARAPLLMLQLLISPMSVRGENNGLEFGQSPFESALVFTTCIDDDPDIGTCNPDPAQSPTNFVDLLIFPAPPGSPLKILFTWWMWLLIALAFCCICVLCRPMIAWETQSIGVMWRELNDACIPWCSTCVLCYCCCWDPEEYARKSGNRHYKEDKAHEREVLMRECGCCFFNLKCCQCKGPFDDAATACCCWGERLEKEDVSSCGDNCGTCDRGAHRCAGDDVVGVEPCAACFKVCRKKSRSTSSSDEVESVQLRRPVFVDDTVPGSDDPYNDSSSEN